MRVLSLVSVSAMALFSALPAVAQDRSFNFAIGSAVVSAPDYMGSSDSEAIVIPTFTFGSLNWGKIDAGNGVRGDADNGFAVGAAFRIIDERTAVDNRELAGLADIDVAVELGLNLKYQETNWMAFGEIRKGVTGHSGVAGTIGADWIMRADNRWKFTVGPRVNFGNDEYADTYFGVDTATTNFAAYDATGGALSAGIQFGGSYYLNDNWSLDGAISYEKLMGDAADSPITVRGSEDQWRIGLGISRQFTINF